MVTTRRGWAARVVDSASALTRPATTADTTNRFIMSSGATTARGPPLILPALSRWRCRLSAVTARLGVDIGGTFTDLVVIDETTGVTRVGKILTTPKDPAHAVEQGIEAIAICLLHAYVNPVHERRLAALVAEIAPQMAVACASEVVPEIREYERTSTTTANVYVAPLMARYLEDLERRLADREIPGQLYIMQSSGGIALPPLARRLPIRLVESGPAAGALAAAQAARERGDTRLLSFDMGGTTAKACVIDD